VEGNQIEQSFNVSYADGTSSSFNQSLSDWAGSERFRGESAAVEVPYRIEGNGSVDGNSFRLWAYRLQLDPSKEAQHHVAQQPQRARTRHLTGAFHKSGKHGVIRQLHSTEALSRVSTENGVNA
jgi:hypothetical protein